MGRLLSILVGLMIWGPPRLRLEQRALETALASPFNLDAAALFQAGVWVLGAVAALIIVLKRYSLPAELRVGPLKWYVLFGVVGIASAVYSSSPLYTLFFASKIVIGCLLAIYADRANVGRKDRALEKIFFTVFVWQWMAITILFVVKPDLVGTYLTVSGYRLNGGILLDYGMSAAMSGLYFLLNALFGRDLRKRLVFVGLYGMTWYFVLLSQTRTTMIGALLVGATLLVLHPSMRVRLYLIPVAIMGLAFLLHPTFGPMFLQVFTRNQGLESLAGLSGRTDALAYLLQWWSHSPLVGYGYGMSREILISFINNSGLGIGAAHDALSKVLVETGIVGALLLIMALGAGWHQTIIYWRHAQCNRELVQKAQVVVALMVWATISCVTSGGIADLSFPFIVACTVSSMPNRIREVRQLDSTQPISK